MQRSRTWKSTDLIDAEAKNLKREAERSTKSTWNTLRVDRVVDLGVHDVVLPSLLMAFLPRSAYLSIGEVLHMFIKNYITLHDRVSKYKFSKDPLKLRYLLS